MILDYKCKRCLITDACKNKYAFQWDAYHLLVDRIPACIAQGGYLPGGELQIFSTDIYLFMPKILVSFILE